MSSSIKPACRITWRIRIFKKQNIRGHWQFVEWYSEFGNATCWRDSVYRMIGMCISVLDEISFTSWFNHHKDKVPQYVFMPMPFHVSERWKIALKRKQKVKVKWEDTDCITLIKKQWESMWKQLHPSGFLNKEFDQCLFIKIYTNTWRGRTSRRKSSRTRESFQCSKNTEWRTDYDYCIQNVEKVKN